MQYTTYKAEEAGKQVYYVNPNGTSQICSKCGTMVKKSLSERTHSCPNCGFSADRDLNASFNILGRLGRDSTELLKTLVENELHQLPPTRITNMQTKTMKNRAENIGVTPTSV